MVSALSNPGGYPGIALAVIEGIFGTAQTAMIASTEFDAGGGGSVDTGGLSGGGSIAAPTIQPPQQQQTLTTTQTQTNANGDFTGFDKPIKAYVVETEISDSQNAVKRIKNNSTF